jgi:hypothetical protein
MPAWLEEETGDLEVVHAGDGWVTCVTELSGTDACLEADDLAARFRRVLGEAPQRPERLDGVPCRNCEQFTLERADPPSDPAAEGDWSRCSDLSCRDRMTAGEYRDWTKKYDAWVKGADIEQCYRCATEKCRDCSWDNCKCAGAGHRAA